MKHLILALVFVLPALAAGKETLLMMGSSTMEFWKSAPQDFSNYNVINMGKGGTEYKFLVENAGAWAKQYPASKILVYSGDNDFASGASA